jgi:hypothetical protein
MLSKLEIVFSAETLETLSKDDYSILEKVISYYLGFTTELLKGNFFYFRRILLVINKIELLQ